MGQENWSLEQAPPEMDQFGFAWLPGGPASAYSIVYVCTTFSLPIGQHLGCLHVLAIVKKAAINVGVQIHFPGSAFILFLCYSIFYFLRDLHIIFHRDYTNLCYNQQCIKVPFLYTLSPSLISCLFKKMCGDKLFLVLICKYLMISDVKH